MRERAATPRATVDCRLRGSTFGRGAKAIEPLAVRLGRVNDVLVRRMEGTRGWEAGREDDDDAVRRMEASGVSRDVDAEVEVEVEVERDEREESRSGGASSVAGVSLGS